MSRSAGPVVLAVDCSTTGAKAVAFDAAGRTVAEARVPYHRTSPRPGWQEQDPADWWGATAGALAGAVRALGPDHRPAALAVTHQRETFVCLDADDRPLRPGVLWLDTRAGEQIARLGSARVHELSGKPPSTAPSLYKLAWLAEHEPRVLRRTALVLDVHGYLVRLLTGTRSTSWASADPLSLLDMQHLRWSPELVAAAGLAVDQLPALVAPGASLGGLGAAAARRTGLPEGLPVVAGAGDGQCAGLGSGALVPGRAYLNLGTALTLGVHSPGYRWAAAYRTLASPLAGAYVLEALLPSGALSIGWFRDALSGLTGERREERLERLAADVPAGARGLLFLPYLSSAETPHWDPHARGAFVGLAEEHGRAEMYRAVLEGLAYEERANLHLLEQDTGTAVEEVVVTGGAARSPLFTQILADVLQRRVLVAREPETTALGAGVLAAAAVGLTGSGDLGDVVGAMTGTGAVLEPDPRPRAVYEEAAGLHAQLYPRLRPLFPGLSRLRTGTAGDGAGPAT
ncbi:xylulokinase [Kineococcus terrestris]|uniref:xylulokinase n=1 Tax=Kineococcus terrestris TaxID=2044856 RepID=UPI0034DB4BE4